MYRKLLPLAVATFAVTTDSLVIAGLLPAIADSLNVTIPSAGQLVTVFALTYAVAAPVLGATTAHLDRRKVLLMGLASFVVGNVLAAVGTTFGVVMLGRVLSALGAALIASIAMASATAIAPPERHGRALALVTGGSTVATTLGVPLGTLIGGTDWRITMWAVAALGLVAGVGIAFGLPRIDLPAARLRDRLQPLRDPGVLAILAVTLGILTSGYVLYTYIGPALADVTGGEAASLTAVLVAYGVGSILGNVVSGFLTDRYRPVRILLIGLVLLVLTLAATPLVTVSLVVTMVWATVWGMVGWLTGLPQQHRLVRRAPDSAALVLGLNVSVLQLGIATGGAVGGVILRENDPVWLGIVSAAIAAVALITTLATLRIGRARPEQADEAEPAAAASGG
ncbi:putative MFS family arabinose efflux permease [Stackebrandtia albiflava]|uniref:Putative MFS family arabinose efflux permease n=1 Tax=Stackebrandtia albiflava TaxID=406432 RepID=A0A562VC15_9ACTN|nr:MFS transporter [Stackebrandtia albiflava]TWJ15419.1 putative MFS family arabinose efflux permease [Stackebrandtia albiflava]